MRIARGIENRIVAELAQGRVMLLRRLGEHAAHTLLRRMADDGRIVLDNPCLFARNRFERVAQIRHVVKPDGGNRAENRVDDVRRVFAPAHADFDNRDIAIFAVKRSERERRPHLERGHKRALRPHLLRCLHKRIAVFHHPRVIQRQTVQPNPLLIRLQKRRRIQPGVIPRAAQDAFEHRAGTALAVRPGDVDNRRAQGDVHFIQQRQHILEAVFAACGVAAVDGGDDFLTVQH